MNTSRLGIPGPAIVGALALSWIGIFGPLAESPDHAPPAPAVLVLQQSPIMQGQS